MRAISVLSVVAFLFAAVPVLAADMDANAKTLAKLDDDWSKAAATRDADRVASFYAENAIAYPPQEPVAIGRPAANRSTLFEFNSGFTVFCKNLNIILLDKGDERLDIHKITFTRQIFLQVVHQFSVHGSISAEAAVDKDAFSVELIESVRGDERGILAPSTTTV